MAIPKSFLRELISRVDIVDVVGSHVELKRAGSSLSGCCPFHSEKSPSFSVVPAKQFYHCFGCGKHGDAVTFLMEHCGMSFVESVTDLAKSCGMEVPNENDVVERAVLQQKASSINLLGAAMQAYRDQLAASDTAIQYFTGRGVSSDVAAIYGLGYAPPGWSFLSTVIPNASRALPQLIESGLVVAKTEGDEKVYDRFRDRVMFPIRNANGECIGFGARTLGDEKPKYLNSPDTLVFNKGNELYGVFEARSSIRKKGYALVVEGYMDVIALAQMGFQNSVATLGTACSANHVQKLFKLTDSVVFSFDGDDAGRRAARRAMESSLKSATDVRMIKFLFLPKEHDPDSFIRKYGSDAFSAMVDDAVPMSRFLLESACEDCDMGSVEGRARMASNAKMLWTQIPNGALKIQILGEVANLLGCSSQELGLLWNEAGDAGRPAAPQVPVFLNGRFVMAGNEALPIGIDSAITILFERSVLWFTLSEDDQCRLCDVPGIQGDLMVWFRSQIEAFGPLELIQLQDALSTIGDEEMGQFAIRLIGGNRQMIGPIEASLSLRKTIVQIGLEANPQSDGVSLAQQKQVRTAKNCLATLPKSSRAPVAA